MRETGFRLLLRLYPRAFRDEFEAPMTALFHQMRADADTATLLGRLRFTLRVLADFVVTASQAWIARLLHRTPEPPQRRLPLAERLAQDVRFALRTLASRPGFTAVVVATLSIGIGANTAIFSLVNEILLRPLPIEEPSRVVDVYAEIPGGNSFSGFSYPDYVDYREQASSHVQLAAFAGRSVAFGEPGTTEPERIRAQFLTSNYFDVVGVSPRLGRGFAAEDGTGGGAAAVALLSHGFWERRFGARPDVVGETMHLNGEPVTIVGVTPEGFTGTFIGYPMDVWVNLASAERILPGFDRDDRAGMDLEMLGRLEPDTSPSEAHAVLDTITTTLETEQPLASRGRGLGVAPTTGVDHSMRSGVRGFLAVLLLLSMLVLVITSLNVGSLLLARTVTREREMGIRVAMGARAKRLVHQLVTETLVLFALGAAGGAIVASLAKDALVRLIEASPLPLGLDLPLDLRVMAFTLGVTLAAALTAGLLPAREALRADPASILGAGRGASGPLGRRARTAFVVVQIAGSVVLLSGAGWFLRSLEEGARLDPGFDADRLALATVVLPREEYDPARAGRFFRALVDDARALPGISGASVSTRRPISVGRSPVAIEVPDHAPAPGEKALWVDEQRVGRDYFTTVGIPILDGRGFEASDDEGAPVVVLNETMRDRYFGETSPLGLSFRVGDETVRVIGVARDSRTLLQDARPSPLVYRPFASDPSLRAEVLLRSDAAPLEAASAVAGAVRDLDATLPAPRFETPRQTIHESLLPQRIAASVTSALGLVGLALASLGLYGALAELVSRRRREFGIRLALGSSVSGLYRGVVASGLKLTLAGLALGAVTASLIAPMAQSYLVGVGPSDPVTLASVALLLLVTSAGASLVPARRATRVDPTTTLRAE